MQPEVGEAVLLDRASAQPVLQVGETSNRTTSLRFVLRDGKRVLQQAWEVWTIDPTYHTREHVRVDWLDVPLVEDGA